MGNSKVLKHNPFSVLSKSDSEKERDLQFQHHQVVSGVAPKIVACASASDDINDLSSSFKPVEVDPEKLLEQAEKIKNVVFGSAEDYVGHWLVVKNLLKIPEETRKLTDAEKQVVDSEAEMRRIDSVVARQPEGVRNQFAFNLLLAYINKLQPNEDSEVVWVLQTITDGGPALHGSPHTVHKRGEKVQQNERERWLNLEKKPPYLSFKDDAGSLFIVKSIPSQQTKNRGRQSRPDVVLFASARQMISRYHEVKKARIEIMRQQDRQMIEELKQLVQKNDHPAYFILRGEPGLYTLYLPAESGNPKSRDGAGQIRVKTLKKEKEGEPSFVVVEAIDGYGSMRFMANKNKGKWVPLWVIHYYRDNKKIPDNIKENMREFYLRMSKVISRTVGYNAVMSGYRK